MEEIRSHLSLELFNRYAANVRFEDLKTMEDIFSGVMRSMDVITCEARFSPHLILDDDKFELRGKYKYCQHKYKRGRSVTIFADALATRLGFMIAYRVRRLF